MFKCFKLYFVLLFSLGSLHANEWVFNCIDFGRFDNAQIHFMKSQNQSLKKIAHFNEFNGALEIGNFIQLLRNDFNIRIAVETGTYHGSTAKFFASCFEDLYTIEIDDGNYLTAKQQLAPYHNAHCFLGSSEQVLKDILPQLQDKKILFYLDAHRGYDSPLKDELDAISKTHRDQCIIVIDDFKVPGRADIGYDRFGNSECSFSSIKEKLSQVFSDYNCYYVIPATVFFRAKFVAIPKKWQEGASAACQILSREHRFAGEY